MQKLCFWTLRLSTKSYLVFVVNWKKKIRIRNQNNVESSFVALVSRRQYGFSWPLIFLACGLHITDRAINLQIRFLRILIVVFVLSFRTQKVETWLFAPMWILMSVHTGKHFGFLLCWFDWPILWLIDWLRQWVAFSQRSAANKDTPAQESWIQNTKSSPAREGPALLHSTAKLRKNEDSQMAFRCFIVRLSLCILL